MTEMASRGRTFAAGALLMVVAQLTAVCAVPLAASAISPAAAHRHSVECCPAGSHPPGQCPLHAKESHSNECRMTCAKQAATPFVPGVAGVLPPSIAIGTAIDVVASMIAVDGIRISRSRLPSSPPPKIHA